MEFNFFNTNYDHIYYELAFKSILQKETKRFLASLDRKTLPDYFKLFSSFVKSYFDLGLQILKEKPKFLPLLSQILSNYFLSSRNIDDSRKKFFQKVLVEDHSIFLQIKIYLKLLISLFECEYLSLVN